MCYYIDTMKLLDRFNKLRLGQKTMIIIAILIVGISSWITYDNVRPRPLGDEMAMKEYFTATYSPLEGLAYKHAFFTSPDGDFMFTYDDRTAYKTKKIHNFDRQRTL